MRFFIIVILLFGLHTSSTAASSIFACDFEDGTMCGMHADTTSVNFTVATGETVTDKSLGPVVDHTLNTSSGHFLYWYRPTQNLRIRVDGIVNTSAFQLQPNLCLKFAYYINSISPPNRLTMLGVSLMGCSEGIIWWVKTLANLGWDTVEIHLPRNTCAAMLSFFVSSNSTGSVSVSMDDISLDICTSTTTISSTTSTATHSSLSPYVLLFFLGIFLYT